MWRELVERYYPEHEFRPPASAASLTAADQRLETTLPSDLRGLLGESDGVFGAYGLGLVWPLARIVDDNLPFRSGPRYREHFMGFAELLFFGDAGNGDQFAFRFIAGEPAGDIFAWDHEDDSRTWVAPELRSYLEWWPDGRIRL